MRLFCHKQIMCLCCICEKKKQKTLFGKKNYLNSFIALHQMKIVNQCKQENAAMQTHTQTEHLKLSQSQFPYAHLAIYNSGFTPRPTH